MPTIHEHPMQEAGHGTLRVQDITWARVLALPSWFFSFYGSLVLSFQIRLGQNSSVIEKIVPVQSVTNYVINR